MVETVGYVLGWLGFAMVTISGIVIISQSSANQ